MLAKDQVINTYRALNNWRSFRLKLFIEGIIIGILSGLIISFFRWSLHLVETNREHIYTFLKNTDWYWTAFWFIALAVIAFTLDRLTKYEPLAAGSGIPQVKGAILGFIKMRWLRILWVKLLAGIIGIGAGLSLGREGPSIQLGAVTAQGLSRLLKRTRLEERYLLTSGASAGLAAAFNAPLAGVIFALEELHRNFSVVVLLPAMAAAMTATVISRIINLIIVATMGAVLIKAKNSPERIAPRKILGQIIKIGFPSACETALYNIAMTLVVRFMNQMDADGMNVTARSYASQIANFSYCIGAALAQANAILTGWHIGAKEYDECDKGTRKAAIYGVITASCLSITFALLGNYIVRIFTNDVQMINLVTKLLAIDVVLELGRVTNLVYGQALKTSGDAVFPVVMGAVFMYLAAVGGTYFFGLHLGLLAVGAYIGLASDECIRAIGMVLRWNSGKWKNKGLVD